MDRLGDYPVWLFMYIGQIILPMLGCVSIAIKILIKNGKDMRRELLGVGAVSVKTYNQQKTAQRHSSIVSASDSVMKAVEFFREKM